MCAYCHAGRHAPTCTHGYLNIHTQTLPSSTPRTGAAGSASRASAASPTLPCAMLLLLLVPEQGCKGRAATAIGASHGAWEGNAAPDADQPAVRALAADGGDAHARRNSSSWLGGKEVEADAWGCVLCGWIIPWAGVEDVCRWRMCAVGSSLGLIAQGGGVPEGGARGAWAAGGPPCDPPPQPTVAASSAASAAGARRGANVGRAPLPSMLLLCAMLVSAAAAAVAEPPWMGPAPLLVVAAASGVGGQLSSSSLARQRRGGRDVLGVPEGRAGEWPGTAGMRARVCIHTGASHTCIMQL